MSDSEPKTLALDVGGTRLKGGLLAADGALLGERVRVATPHPSPPSVVVELLIGLAGRVAGFERVSVGFPGVVRDGVIIAAPNLGTGDWGGFGLAQALEERLGVPVRVLNDASVQGLGVIAGVGLECVITLGTGFGFALYQDGKLLPHLEMSQHVVWKKMTYDDYIGNAALKKVGMLKWQARVQRIIGQLRAVVMFDSLLIGGGNAANISFALPNKVRIVSNDAGILGGVRLWDANQDEAFKVTRAS